MMVIDTLPKAFLDRAQKKPQRVAMRWKHLGIWRGITWSEYLEQTKRVALGLYALGVRRGDHIAIIGENKPEWIFSAFGAMCNGAIYVGIYTTNPTKECEYVVGHSGSVVYLCEDEEQLDKALEFRANTPALKKMVVWDMEGLRHYHDPMLMSFGELLELGKKTDEENPGLFLDLVNQSRPEDVAGIIYTSGTTGMPKGAMLTHEGYLWMGQKVCQVAKVTENDETISFLPLNHIFEQIFDFLVHIVVGHIVNFTENTDTVMSDMIDVSPTIFHAVPRIWEKYYSGIVIRMDDATWLKRTAYKLAVKIGTAYNDMILAKQKPPLWLTAANHIAYYAVFWKLKKRLGFDRMRLGISGAAPISHNILKFLSGRVTD
jgi:long-chain acyl-CoA synthetase